MSKDTRLSPNDKNVKLMLKNMNHRLAKLERKCEHADSVLSISPVTVNVRKSKSIFIADKNTEIKKENKVSTINLKNSHGNNEVKEKADFGDNLKEQNNQKFKVHNSSTIIGSKREEKITFGEINDKEKRVIEIHSYGEGGKRERERKLPKYLQWPFLSYSTTKKKSRKNSEGENLTDATIEIVIEDKLKQKNIEEEENLSNTTYWGLSREETNLPRERQANINRFSNSLPSVFLPFLTNVIDETPDGHCSFRAVVRGIGLETENTHLDVRRSLLSEILIHRQEYT